MLVGVLTILTGFLIWFAVAQILLGLLKIVTRSEDYDDLPDALVGLIFVWPFVLLFVVLALTMFYGLGDVTMEVFGK